MFRCFPHRLRCITLHIMLYVLLWICVITARVHSVELTSLQHVHVNNSLLTWTPTHQHNHATYTVQYRRFDSETWEDVPSCVETALTSCDVTRTQNAAKYGCVALRVQAQTHKLNSTPVEACTRLGDSCGPSVGLSAQPGILSVTLSSNHRLLRNHNFAAYNVYYGLEGLPQEEYKIYAPDSSSSVSIKELDEGLRYCVYVQIVLYDIDVGPPSCLKCMVIPESGEKLLQQHKIITSVFIVIILVVLSVGMAHVLLHQQEKINRIKQWFKPEPTPQSLCPLPDHHRLLVATTPPEDQYDRISTFAQEEQGLTSVQET